MRLVILGGPAALLVLMSIAGCSGPVGPTDGFVRFTDETPVASGGIEFRNLSDKQRYSSRIARDGSFHPTSQDGVPGLPPGDYEVVIVQIVLTEDLAKQAHDHGHTVPRRYADYYTSDLRWSVLPEQSEPISITVEQS